MPTETYKYFRPEATNLRAAYGGGAIQNGGDSAEITPATLTIRALCAALNIPSNRTDQLFVQGVATDTFTYIRVSDLTYSAISSLLTTSELASVVSTAPTGWTLNSNLARFQPISGKTTIIVRGDSISAGLGTTSGLPNQVYSKQGIELIAGEVLTALPASSSDFREMISKSYALHNISLGGSSWANTVSQGLGEEAYPKREDLAFNQRALTLPLDDARCIFVYWLGTNDLSYDATLTGAQAWTRANTRIAALRAAFPNLKIVIGTVVKRSESSTLNNRINDFNVALRAGHVSAGANVLMDFEANVSAVNLTTGNTGNATYYTDGTHLTTAGHALLAPVFRDAILAAQALF
jgi:lysophospholipase L1-like esterase